MKFQFVKAWPCERLFPCGKNVNSETCCTQQVKQVWLLSQLLNLIDILNSSCTPSNLQTALNLFFRSVFPFLQLTSLSDVCRLAQKLWITYGAGISCLLDEWKFTPVILFQFLATIERPFGNGERLALTPKIRISRAWGSGYRLESDSIRSWAMFA